MNFQETAEKKKIDREGIETAALPLSKIERKGRRGSKTYKLEIQYPDQAGGTHTQEVTVPRDLYDNIEANPILNIKYLKEQPTKLVVVGPPLESPEMNYVGIGLLAFGLFGTWWNFIRKKPAAQPQEPVSA